MYVTNQLQEVFHPITTVIQAMGHTRPYTSGPRMVNTEEGGDVRKGELLHLQT